MFNFLEKLCGTIGRGPVSERKHRAELRYWTKRKRAEGTLENTHFKRYYTTLFDLEPESYTGKRILDVGCGPRGSLEWATMAAERVGLDPLADSYLELGASAHEMSYVNANSEEIPFADGHFDVVCTFNCLDHVNDLDETIDELIRVLAPGGLLLLLTDLNHEPTECEPITFSWDVVELFKPSLSLLWEKHFEKSQPGLYQSLDAGVVYDHDMPGKRYGVLAAKFHKAHA